jgi:hypothetical protein
LELNFPVLDWYDFFFKLPLTRTCWVWEKESRKHLIPGPVCYVQKLIPAQDRYIVYTSLTPELIPGLYLPYIPGQNEPWMQYQVPNWFESCKKVPNARTSLLCSKADTSPTLHRTMMEVKWPTAPSPPSKEMHWAWY